MDPAVVRAAGGNSRAVLHETGYGFDRPDQRYELQRTYFIPTTEDSSAAHKVRVTVHCDSSYPGQSRYRAELWTGEQWNEIARLAGEDPRAVDSMASGYLPRERRDEVRASAEAMAEVLISMAEAVLA